MARSNPPGPLGFDFNDGAVPANTPGPLGRNDQAEPGANADLGDTPGPLGVRDASALLAGGIVPNALVAGRMLATVTDVVSRIATHAAKALDLLRMRNEIVRIANEERLRWHPLRTTGRRAGTRRRYRETSRAMRAVLADYWRTGAGVRVHHSRFSTEAWSSAFVCWVMRQAKARDLWVYTRRHSEYINAAIRNRESNNGNPFRAYPVNEAVPEPGDVVCANRGGGRIDFDDARRRTRYKSHSDIVVAREGSRILTIGGNIAGNTVGMKRVRLDSEGHLRPRRYFAVIKIELPSAQST